MSALCCIPGSGRVLFSLSLAIAPPPLPPALQLFVNGEWDDMCPAGELRGVAEEAASKENAAEVPDMRAVVLPVSTSIL